MTVPVNDAPRRYINAIRNERKQAYARAYWDWILGNRDEYPRPILIGTMAAQAVRLELHDYAKTAGISIPEE